MTVDDRVGGLSEEKRRLFEKLKQGKEKKRATGPIPPPAGGEGCVVSLKSEGKGIPFVCVHAITGSVFPYHKLALRMDRPFYGIQAHGLLEDEEPRKTLPEMAEAYVQDLKRHLPEGPYHLGGYSFGGWVALEMASLLKEEMGALAVFGVPMTATASMPQLAEHFDYMARYADDWQRLATHTAMAEGKVAPPHAEKPSGMSQVIWANGWAQARWVPPKWAGRVDLFLTSEQTHLFAQERTMGWGAVCEDVRPVDIKGNHLNLFEEPQVQDLADALNRVLDEVEA